MHRGKMRRGALGCSPLQHLRRAAVSFPAGRVGRRYRPPQRCYPEKRNRCHLRCSHAISASLWRWRSRDQSWSAALLSCSI